MANIDIWDKKVIEKVISYVDSFVYKSKDATPEEVDEYIKDNLKDMYKDFFGKNHEGKVDKKIDNMKIVRCYNILGPKNSISQLLIDIKEQEFNKKRKFKISKPENLFYYLDTPFNEMMNDINASSESRWNLQMLCLVFGMTIDDLYDPKKQEDFYFLVNEAYKEYENTPYSKDEKTNNKMMFLQHYVDSYIDSTKLMYRMLKKSPESYYGNHKEIISRDPIFKELTKYVPMEIKTLCAQGLFNSIDVTAAMHNSGTIYLGINPNGEVVVHEGFHALVEKRDGTTGLHTKEKYRYFNEVVTEYFSQKMYKKFRANNGDLTFNDKLFQSSYGQFLFEYMTPFINQYEAELKEVLIGNKTVDDLKKIIGDKEFENIAECCDTIMSLGHNLYSKNGSKAKIKAQGIKLEEINKKVIKEKSPLEMFANAMNYKTEEFANFIASSGSRILKKLAEGMYGLVDIRNKYSQNEARKTIAENRSKMTAEDWLNLNIGGKNDSFDEMFK